MSWDGHRQSAARPYRSDIDGLRAVAVLSVIAFHVKFSAFPGGYIGVDVFFVISGYLIGSIILEEVRAGRFSLLAFYERRVRRIFPALAALLILLSVPAYLYLLPNELTAYGGSVLAATFSVSNFYFLLHTGYFAAPAYYLPLLHTWSLAIEEQFYIFLPLFILLLHRLVPRLLPLLLLAATILSFVALPAEDGGGSGGRLLSALDPGLGAAAGDARRSRALCPAPHPALAQCRSAGRAGADPGARRGL